MCETVTQPAYYISNETNSEYERMGEKIKGKIEKDGKALWGRPERIKVIIK